jgi:hypothetical protein
MKPLVFLPSADGELNEAAVFYESSRRGLGSEFQEAIQEAIDRIRENPETGFLSQGRTRTLTAKRFPFGVVFKEYSDHILIVAIAHSSRREAYWINRIAEDEE